MLSYAFKKYLKGFHNFLPFIVINLIIDLITLRIFSVELGGNSIVRALNLGEEIDWNMVISSPESQGLTLTFFLVIGITLLISPILNSYITLIIKRVVNKEEVKHMNCLKEGLKYYIPYIGVSLTIFLMLMGLLVVTIMVAAFIPFLGIIGGLAGFIFFIYLAVSYSPCTSYLLYYDVTISEALHFGKEVGKKYFWRILGVVLVINIISKVIGMADSSNIMIYIIVTLITLVLNIFNMTYTVSLCKGYKTPEIEYDYEDSEH